MGNTGNTARDTNRWDSGADGGGSCKYVTGTQEREERKNGITLEMKSKNE